MSGARLSRRSLFRKFSNVPNGIPVAEHGEALYTVEPLHAEILLQHRLARLCDDPYCGALHLYDDTFISEVVEVLSTPPEYVEPPAWMIPVCPVGQDANVGGQAA